MKNTFNVFGMSCANCVNNVEKAVRKLNGVEEVSVNLIEEMMIVSFDESRTDVDSIKEAVSKAGYKAELRGDTDKSSDSKSVSKSDGNTVSKEEKSIKAGLIASVIIIVVLMIVARGPKWDISTNALLQFILVIPVLIINRHFFINAFKALRNGGTNMDVLVSLGSLCALIYSLYGLCMILISFANPDLCELFIS